MKCINCQNPVLASDLFCDRCGAKIIRCSKCNNPILENDVFCGICGNNVQSDLKEFHEKEKNKLEKEKANYQRKILDILERKLEQEKKEFSINVLIDSEGNKFKAIKEFRDKFDVDVDIATNYINTAYSQINSNKKQYDEMSKSKTIGEPLNVSRVEKQVSYVNPNGIKKTIIVASSSRKKATSAVSRGLVGGFLLGPVGLLAGTTAKTKDTTTFQVIYNNGKKENITVKNGSWMFNQYCKYLDE